MEIIFVLVGSSVPENVGAAARALKTMGFETMRLVHTEAHRSEKAYWVAHGAADLLDSAVVYESFQEAVEDLDFVIGTTSKHRSVKYDYYTPEDARALVEAKGPAVRKIGLVFGSEESGLDNVMLAGCDIASTIPLAVSYPSLNLGQSVMLYAYVFNTLSRAAMADPQTVPADSYIRLKSRVSALLDRLGLPGDRNLHRRILERIATAGVADVPLMLSICNRMEEALERK